jgi:lipoprotein-anchoring transpeptidase ErfK/SrfK
VAPDTSPSPEPPKVTLTPADGSTGVPPTSPVSVEAQEGTLSTVTVKSASGGAVQGAIDGSGKKWSSKGKLAFGATYTIEVTASGDTAPRQAGKFSTTPTPGSAKSVRASSILGDHKTYGVAMPIILKLDDSLPTKAQRAAFEQGLTVKSTPPATGAWGWINSKEIHFRPAEFWAAGSTVHLGVDTAGRDLGNGMWGRTDLTVDFKIGTKRELRADSKSHHMLVWESGKLVKDMPVSLGRPKFPSSRGTMVIIDKRPTAMFDSSTYGLPVDDPEGYRTKVDLPMRLTWGGEFIHSAPWSVNQQGKVNVSHGCINVAPANAQWLYNRIQVGDPVTVLNTEEAVKFGDGYMDWSLPFNGWLSHSASGQHSTA